MRFTKEYIEDNLAHQPQVIKAMRFLSLSAQLQMFFSMLPLGCSVGDCKGRLVPVAADFSMPSKAKIMCGCTRCSQVGHFEMDMVSVRRN